MEQQSRLPCVQCLSVHSCSPFTGVPIKCVHATGGTCLFCRDGEKACTKVPERLTHLALLLCQLLRLASQENRADASCPVLCKNIRIVRRDFFQHMHADPDIERGEGALAEIDADDQEFLLAPLQEAARVTIEEFEDVQIVLRRILPSLNSMSDYFLETSGALRDMSKRLTIAVTDNYLLYRRRDE